MIYIGVDPGKEGGIVCLTETGGLFKTEKMPKVGKEYDLSVILSLFDVPPPEEAIVFIEEMITIPGQGSKSNATIGFGHGMLYMAFVANKVPFRVVRPQTWQKDVGVAKKLKGKARKDALVSKANQRWPDIGKHSGICDAALIADWGRRNEMRLE